MNLLVEKENETRRKNRKKYLDEEISAQAHFQRISENAKAQTKQALMDRDMRVPSRENMRANRELERRIQDLRAEDRAFDSREECEHLEPSVRDAVSEDRLSRLKSISDKSK